MPFGSPDKDLSGGASVSSFGEGFPFSWAKAENAWRPKQSVASAKMPCLQPQLSEAVLER